MTASQILHRPKIAASGSKVTAGEGIAMLIHHWGIHTVFGVISIHNMPILDPLGRRGEVRYIAARGEAGAANMADAYARVSGQLGVVFTSTGTAAGNAAGAMVEALTAGSPVLHITGQVPSDHLGQDRAYIHEAPDQASMLAAISKEAFTVSRPEDVLPTIAKAAKVALSAPTGPVSVEITIDAQAGEIDLPEELPALDLPEPEIDAAVVEEIAQRLRGARRPVILLGGGARDADDAAQRLADRGIAIVTSTNGRGIVDEQHPMSLGAFNCTRELQAFYEDCDLMVICGSRLRGNETWTYRLDLPSPRIVIDLDTGADGRTYDNDGFYAVDCRPLLEGLAEALSDYEPASDYRDAVAVLKETMRNGLAEDMQPYTPMVEALQNAMPDSAAWVRDVTISNSMWGNRYLMLQHDRAGVHAVGGGIGQGLPMAIGAAFGNEAAGRSGGAIALSGDGGLNLCLGELVTAVDEKADLKLILMNDSGYGVIRNIQDAQYGGRKYYSNIKVPDFALVAQSIDLPHMRVAKIDDFDGVLRQALATPGPVMIEVDMTSIGHYSARFAGPPVRTS